MGGLGSGRRGRRTRGDRWTEDQENALRDAVRAHGAHWMLVASAVAAATGIRRTAKACETRYHGFIGPTGSNALIKMSPGPKPRQLVDPLGWLRKLQAEELAARRGDTRSLTGKLMGDPMPGRSALDKKRAREATPVLSLVSIAQVSVDTDMDKV